MDIITNIKNNLNKTPTEHELLFTGSWLWLCDLRAQQSAWHLVGARSVHTC